MNKNEYVDYYNDYANYTGNIDPISDKEKSSLPNTDWFHDISSKNQALQNHHLSLSGGGQIISYYASGGIYDQQGIYGGEQGKSDYNRKILNYNIDIHPIPQMSIKAGAQKAISNRNYIDEFRVIGNLYKLPPIFAIYEDGEIFNTDITNSNSDEGILSVFQSNNPMIGIVHEDNNTTINKKQVT